MKQVDLSPIVSCDSAYEVAARALAQKYTAAWDDAVHDSFYRFQYQNQENGRKLHDIRTSAELIEKAIGAHDVEALQRKSLALVREAEAL